MAKQPLTPSAALAKMLRQRRQELGLSLRQVQEQTENLGNAIPFTTLAKVEHGKVDPGVKRLHLLCRLYDVPLQLAGDMLDLEQFAQQSAEETIADDRMYDAWVAAWHEGDLRTALSHLVTLRARVSTQGVDRRKNQRALLSFAIAAGSLGKYRLAQSIIDDLLLESPEPDLLVPVLVQAAQCWHARGSCQAALAFLSQAEANLEPGDARSRAWIQHARASVQVTLGQFEPALEELQRAIESYQEAGDTYGESRALAVRVRAAFDMRDFDGALTAAREAVLHATQHEFGRLTGMRRIDEGRALIELQQNETGLQTLRDALAASISSGDPIIQFYSHHALWKAQEKLGDQTRASIELSAAQHYVRFVDEVTPETTEVRSTMRRNLS